jgi:hypothetical protein
MASHSIAATFSDLPTEMKATVFAYIRQNTHRSAVCLVSRQCRDVMRPILWKTLYLKAATKSPGQLACLLSPDNGVLAHVRYIDILADAKSDSVLNSSPEFGAAVELIIGALKRDCLLGITFGTELDMSTVLNILQFQQSLQTLRFRYPLSAESPSISLSLVAHSSWVTPMLRNIQQLRIPISDGSHESDENNKACENSAYLLNNTPKIKSLCLKGGTVLPSLVHRSRELDAFGGPYTKGTAIQSLGLIELQLLRLDLETYPASIFAHINFHGLQFLSISKCRKVGAFLTALVVAVPQATLLRTLEISVRPKRTSMNTEIQAVEAVVASTSSLEKLWLDVGKGRAFTLSCLDGKAKSLRQLALLASSKSHVAPYYNSSELGKLLEQAPNLESLAINLCPVSLGPVRYLATEFKLSAQAEEGSDFDDIKSLLVGNLLLERGQKLTTLLG